MISGHHHVLATFGDSIAGGLGVRRARYVDIVASELKADLRDYSHTGWTVADSLAAYREDPKDCTLAVIAHGITEPIYRPRPRLLRFMPSRWRRRGWMDPRPYFSSHFRRRFPERLESAIRWRVKNLLIRLGGGEQLLTPDEYRAALVALISEVTMMGAEVWVLGPPPLEERFFPGSPRAQDEYAAIARDVAPHYISLTTVMRRWDDFLADRFHPNDEGHARIAELVIDAIRGSSHAP